MVLKAARVAHNRQSTGKWSWFDDGTALPDPPTGGGGGSSTMLLGVSEWSWISDGAKIVTDLHAVNPQADIQCVRRYDGTVPPAFSSSKGQQDVGQGRASWLSFSGPSISAINSGSEDARIASYFASIPATHRHFFTYLHETDNGKLGGSSAAQFASACARIWNLKNANAQTPANVSVGPILTAGPYRNNTFRQYYPSGGEFDFIGADPYRFSREAGAPPDPKTGGTGTPRTMAYLIGALPAFSQETGKPCAIGEYGAHPTTTNVQDRPDWLRETDAFLRSIGSVVACYFHSSAGESGPWWVDRWHFNVGGKAVGDPDPTSLAAFADLLASNKVALT